jgi:phosphoserine phosphatase
MQFFKMKGKKCKYYCYKNTRAENQFKKKTMDKLELVVFDMDGVLTDIISSWKYIHDYFKTSNRRSVNEYLKGKIDDMEFIKRDSSLWVKNNKPITRKKLTDILSDVPIMNGAKKCIGILKKNKIKTAIVSAGIDILADKVAKELGIDHVYSNGVKIDKKGYLTGVGILKVRLMYKDEAVLKVSKQLNIPLQRIATVGNSCFDIPMFNLSGFAIAFNPEDDCIKESADVIVKGKDLTKIIPHLENYIK